MNPILKALRWAAGEAWEKINVVATWRELKKLGKRHGLRFSCGCEAKADSAVDALDRIEEVIERCYLKGATALETQEDLEIIRTALGCLRKDLDTNPGR